MLESLVFLYHLKKFRVRNGKKKYISLKFYVKRKRCIKNPDIAINEIGGETMEAINQQLLTGERSLFKSRDLMIKDSVFADGESPLKESNDIFIDNSIFKWKYPLWYCQNI